VRAGELISPAGYLRSHFNGFSIVSVGIAVLMLLPVIAVVHLAFNADQTIWIHLKDTVLSDYVTNSFLLVLGVGFGVLALGVPAAWFTSVCDFPGQRVFAWALLLPLAFPAYIVAYTYTGLLDYAGPVQTLVREITGLGYGEYWFFEVRSLPGAIGMLTLVLYPYVYLLSRAAFLEQSVSILEVSRTLGHSVSWSFFRLAVPLSRPAIATGLSLALMETLADYGTVQYFGISTFTTGIFRTFYGFGDVAAAAQLASVLLLFVVALIISERYSRREARYYAKGTSSSGAGKIKLTGVQAVWAWIGCMIPLTFGFLIPLVVLSYWSFFEAKWADSGFLLLVWHSFYLASITAVVAVILALVLSYADRLQTSKWIGTVISSAGFGYAVPGTIVAVGVLIPLVWLDHQIISAMQYLFSIDTGLLLSGTLVALIFSYTVRFLAVSLGTVKSGLDKISPSIDYAARSLGQTPTGIVRFIHAPLMKSSVITALLIVFVDVLKELPATLMLRPFDFNTLAVRAFELASDERLADSAPASIMIVLVGIVPVILLSRSISAGHAGSRHSIHER